jgi:Ca-activated chloride channel homolog
VTRFAAAAIPVLFVPVVLGLQPSFRAEARLVIVHATVKNAHGELVTNLDRGAFTVYENGRPQPITVFRRDDVPVSLGLLIDNSGSMRPLRARVEAAALALARMDSVGGTAMRDAVETAQTYLSEHGTRGRKVLVVVTDGIDNASSATRSRERMTVHARTGYRATPAALSGRYGPYQIRRNAGQAGGRKGGIRLLPLTPSRPSRDYMW